MSYQLYPRHQHDSGKRYCNLATNMQHYHWVLTVHWRKLHFDCCLRSRHKKRGLICLSVGRCAVNTHHSCHWASWGLMTGSVMTGSVMTGSVNVSMFVCGKLRSGSSSAGRAGEPITNELFHASNPFPWTKNCKSNTRQILYHEAIHLNLCRWALHTGVRRRPICDPDESQSVMSSDTFCLLFSPAQSLIILITAWCLNIKILSSASAIEGTKFWLIWPDF